MIEITTDIKRNNMMLCPGSRPAYRSRNGVSMKKEQKNEQKTPAKMTSKQIVAIAGIAVLVLLYLASLAAAILDSSSAAVWFKASLFGTVALPLLIWIYVWLYGKMTGRHTIADAPESESSLADSSAASAELHNDSEEA